MPNCKICGRAVLSGTVTHSECLEQLVTEAAEQFCDNYCVWPDMHTSQERLQHEHCDSCPMERLMKLVKKSEETLC